MKNELCSTITSVLHCGWIEMKCQNTIWGKIIHQKTNDVSLVVQCCCHPLQIYETQLSQLQQMYTSTIWMKLWVNLHLNDQDWSGQFSCKPMLDHMLHKECCSQVTGSEFESTLSPILFTRTLHQLTDIHGFQILDNVTHGN